MASCLEDHLADLFGLNQSKYQWAVDEYMLQERQKKERKERRAAAKKANLAEEVRAPARRAAVGRDRSAPLRA